MRVPAAAISFPDEDREWILSQIDESLRSGQLTLGQIGRQLEAEFAAAHDVAHAVSVSSGTSAVEIPLRVLECKGKEVLVQANTFFATAAAAVWRTRSYSFGSSRRCCERWDAAVVRICCVMPRRHTCWRGRAMARAPTCASSRRCSATRVSPRPSDTPE